MAAPLVFEDWTGSAPRLPFYFRMFLAGPHRNFHYAIGERDARKAILVDPAFELEGVFAAVERDGYAVERALITHGHWDHIGGVEECARRGVKELVVHREGAGHPKLAAAAAEGAEVRAVDDGEGVGLDGLPIELVWTPGHQPDASCFLAGAPGGPRILFGGDTLFIGACGRTDFPGGDTDAMYGSMARLRNLGAAEEVHVMPGHHYAKVATRPLRSEVALNPALSTTDRQAFGRLPCLRG